MKKLLLTTIVVLACVVNAQEYPTGTEWEKTKWSSAGRNNEDRDVLYHADNGTVQFNYSWGGLDKNRNQMWTYERTDKNTGWKYAGGTFEFTSDYVWTNFDTQPDIRHKVDPGTIVEYGYYTIGADGKANDPVMLYKDAEGMVENSVIFQKGDKIGIYMKIDKNGDLFTITSSNSNVNIQGASAASPNVDTDSRGAEKQYFCLFDNRPGQKGIDDVSHYEYFFGGLIASNGSYDEFIEQVIKEDNGKTNITDSDGNPVSGQPLPGTLATLLIGGLCAGSLRKRNKK